MTVETARCMCVTVQPAVRTCSTVACFTNLQYRQCCI